MRLRTLTILAALAATLAGCGKYETWEFDNNCSGYLFTDHKARGPATLRRAKA